MAFDKDERFERLNSPKGHEHGEGLIKPSMLFQLRDGHIPQRANSRQDSAQCSNAFFALCAAQIVFAGCDFVLHHGIADDQLGPRRQPNQPVFQRTAIQQ